MTQRHREAISVDINNKEKVTAPSGKERISRATWSAQVSHEEACRRVEEQLKLQHQRQLDQYNSDPTVQRVSALESKVERLRVQIENLILTLESKKL